MNEPADMNEGSADPKLPALVASYSIDVTLRQAGPHAAGDPTKSHVLPDAIVEEDPFTLGELPIREIEGVLKSTLEDYGYTVHVRAKRTD